MAGISRASFPTEFNDTISQKLLLAPEPQYLHALLIKGALELQFDDGAMDALVALRGPSGGSGIPYQAPDAGRLVLADELMSEAIVVVPELSTAGIGHTVRINRPKYTDSTYTRESRQVPVGTTISTTSQTVSGEQVPITLERFAGPYNNTASAVQPYALERFDATRSIHDLEKMLGTHLKRDFDKWINNVGVVLFDSASTTVRPDGMTTDNSSVVAGDYPMDWATLSKVETSLVNNSVPTFPNGKYMAVLHQYQCEQLQRDPEYQRLAVFEPPLNPLYRGAYVKSAGNFMIFRSTTLTSSTNSNSVSIKYGQAFGAGMVGCGMAPVRPGKFGPQVVPSTSDNYGETTLWVWLAYMGFSVMDDRFGVSIHTS